MNSAGSILNGSRGGGSIGQGDCIYPTPPHDGGNRSVRSIKSISSTSTLTSTQMPYDCYSSVSSRGSEISTQQPDDNGSTRDHVIQVLPDASREEIVERENMYGRGRGERSRSNLPALIAAFTPPETALSIPLETTVATTLGSMLAPPPELVLSAPSAELLAPLPAKPPDVSPLQKTEEQGLEKCTEAKLDSVAEEERVELVKQELERYYREFELKKEFENLAFVEENCYHRFPCVVLCKCCDWAEYVAHMFLYMILFVMLPPVAGLGIYYAIEQISGRYLYMVGIEQTVSALYVIEAIIFLCVIYMRRKYTKTMRPKNLKYFKV